MRPNALARIAALILASQVAILIGTVFLFSPPIPDGRLLGWLVSGLLFAGLCSAGMLAFVPAFLGCKVKAMQWYLFVAPIYFIFFVLMVTAQGLISFAGALLCMLSLIQYAFAIAAIRSTR